MVLQAPRFGTQMVGVLAFGFPLSQTYHGQLLKWRALGVTPLVETSASLQPSPPKKTKITNQQAQIQRASAL